MQGRCSNCNRLIFDVSDPSTLPREVVCQHCGAVNEIPKMYVCRQCGAVFSKPIEKASHIRKEHRGR